MFVCVQNYTLVEYHDVESVNSVLADCKQFPNIDRIPVQSRLLYFHPGRERFHSGSRQNFPIDHHEFVDSYRLNVLTEVDLQKCTSVGSII